MSSTKAEPVTINNLLTYEKEHHYFLQSPRKAYGMRLREALALAIEQSIREDGGGQATAVFIEQAIIQRLGGVAGMVKLINRGIEARNRKERAIDALNPKLWSINNNFELVQDQGATY